ncbi:MAG: GNAT family N-acetyltransferase [Geminicoccaceae bacterium]
MTTVIRTMSRAEVELALKWAAAEGWNPGLDDATPFQVADPHGFVAALVDGEPAAMVSVVRYGADFGFLGLYIAAPGHRGRGLGLQVWNAGLERLADRTVGLDGVVAQQDNYRRSGFAYAWPNYRFGGRVAPGTETGLVDARSLPFDAIAALDRELFPGPRPAFLATWLAMPASRSLGLIEDGRLVGLGTIRRCRQGCKIGPLYAPSRGAAERLIGGLAVFAAGDELFLDVPGPNAEAMVMVADLGLDMRFETARMYRGPAPALPLQRIFGITTFELG